MQTFYLLDLSCRPCVLGRTGMRALLLNRAEGEAVAQLHHPNIVQIYEVGEEEGRPFFSLEYIEGGSLAQHLKGQPMAAREAAGMTELLARAIQVAHDQGIIHRDLKPANVLLKKADSKSQTSEVTKLPSKSWSDIVLGSSSPETLVGIPKITDFGLAKKLDAQSQTRSGDVMGTPSYMAPEQAGGRIHEIGPQADVYALGAILYEMLTGRPPFRGENLYDTLNQVMAVDPVPPSRLVPRCPRDLETICLKCLQKEQRKRYSTALELAADLTRFLNEEPISARPASRLERGVKWVKRRPAVAGLIAVSVAALMLFTGLIIRDNRVLQEKVDQARADEAAARQAQYAAEDDRRRVGVRAEAERMLREAEAALGQMDLQAANRKASEAKALSGGDPELADLNRAAEGLRLRIDQVLSARDAYARFFDLRDAALFKLNERVLTSLDRPDSSRQAEKDCRDALDLFQCDLLRGQPPQIPASFSKAQKEAVLQGTYEVCLLLAQMLSEPRNAADPASRQKRLSEAQTVLDAVGKLQPATPSYHQRRARCLTRTGNNAGAAKELALATSCPPGGALDAFLTGYDLWLEDHKLTEAMPHFERAVQLEPGHFWSHFFLAVGHLRLLQSADARASLSVCASLQPNFPWTYLLRGSIASQLGQFAEAESDYQKVERLTHDSMANYILLVNRGQIRIRQQKWDEAIKVLLEAQKLNASDVLVHVNLKAAYLGVGNYPEARRQIDEAIRLQAGQGTLYRERAMIAIQQSDARSAVEDFRKAIQATPKDQRATLAEYHIECGLALTSLGRWEEALQECKAALEARENDRLALKLQSDCLVHLKNYTEALDCLDAVLSQNKYDSKAYYQRGAIHQMQGRHLAAINDLTLALIAPTKDVPTAQMHTLRGWAYLGQAAASLALQDFEQSLKLEPGNGEAYTGRGLARMQLGQMKPAIQDAEEAVALAPADRQCLYKSAVIYAQAVAAVDRHLVTSNRQEAVDRRLYVAKAMKLLRRTLETIPANDRLSFGRDVLRKDPALDSVRRIPEFQELLAEFALSLRNQ